MRALLLASALLITAASLLAFGVPTTTADHAPQGDNDGKYVLRGYTKGNRGTAMPANALDPDGFAVGIPAIARNIVDGAAADPIDVCAAGVSGSESKYAEIVENAVDVWNKGLGVNIFAYRGTETVTLKANGTFDKITTTNCADYTRELELASIVVRMTHNPKKECGSPLTYTACFDADTIEDHPWLTYTGRSQILIHKSVFDDLNGKGEIATIAHELGHAIGFSHPYELDIFLPIPGHTPVHGGKYIGWEVHGCPGHLEFKHGSTTLTRARNITGISDRKKNLYEGISKSVHGGALALPGSNCKGDHEVSTSQWEWRGDVSLRPYDVSLYNRIYSPSAVTNLSVKASIVDTRKVDVTWDVGDVHVEKGFILQVRVTSGWHELARVGPNTSRVTVDRPTSLRLSKTSSGATVYRLISYTDAFGSAPPETTSTVSIGVGGSTSPPGRGGGGGNGGGGVMETCTQTLTVYASQRGLGGSISVSGHTSKSGNVYVFACGKTATVTAASRVTLSTGTRMDFSRWEGACRGTDPASCSVKVSGSRILRAIYTVVPPPGSYTLHSKQVTRTDWSWSASCDGKSGGIEGYSSELNALANGAQWVIDNCVSRYSISTSQQSSVYTTWGWSGACTDGSGATGSGRGFATSTAASTAGWAWASATCSFTTDDPEPLEPVEILVSADRNVYTYWGYRVTCSNGTQYTGSGYSSRGDAISAANAKGRTSCPVTYSLTVSDTTSTSTLYRYEATCKTGGTTTTSDYRYPSPETAGSSANGWIWDNCE